jgi:hypothetical protein
MTREFFNKQFAALCAAYPTSSKLGDESQDVYWEMLKDIPEPIFAAGVRRCLASSKFFPTIAELGEASLPAKTVLSDYRVPTINGLDKVPVRIGWEQQIEEIVGKRKRLS